MKRLMVINIPQLVKKRIYKVDVEKLQQTLRISRKSKGLTYNTIAEKLNLPKTKVEHWFRTDAYFDIPDPDIWFDLSKLLNINDSELTKQITTFKYQEGLFEKSERHYFEDGLAPTILAGINDKIIVRKYGSSSNSTDGQHNRPYI